jgi:hypothetical protein
LNEISPELTRAVKRVARSVAFNWPDTVLADDLEQDLWVEILTSPATLAAVQGAEPPLQYRLLTRLANRKAGSQRDDYEFFSGNFKYAVDDVKKLLSRGALTEALSGFDSALIDLDIATDALPPQYLDAVERRYINQEVPKAGADKERLSAALASLTTQMNRSNKQRCAEHLDGPGTRKAMSNSASRAVTEA